MKWIWKKLRIASPAKRRELLDKEVRSRTNRKLHEKLMQHERYFPVSELVRDFKDFVVKKDLYCFRG